MKNLPLLFTLLFFLTFGSSLKASLLPFEKEIIQVYQKSMPSVVSVTSHRLARSWHHGITEIPVGMGSGFIWDDQGHIVTNYHVAQDSQKFKITFQGDKKEYPAKLVGVDPKKDIAVLKIISQTPLKLNPIKVGKSKSLLVGQLAIALGNPFGLKHSMSLGIISALQRQIEGIGGVKIYDMIQTDAAINRGNSGGPLLDSSGKLIGMNTMIFSTSGSNAGLGFAVPVDKISLVVPQLIKYGKIKRPGLGVGLLPDHMKESVFHQKKGILISTVQKGSSAEKAGLRGIKRDPQGRLIIGDIILEIDKKPINSYDDIYNLLDHYKVGDKVKVKILRNEKKLDIFVVLQAL